MQLRSAALSDLGRVRKNNEDRLLRDETLQLFGIADGVGGLPGGAEAAQCAIEVVHAGIHNAASEPDLRKVTIEANHSVAQLGRRLSPQFGIGSTLTFGLFRRGQLHLAHVGDSRCYLWSQGKFIALTEDHSVENEAKARIAKGEMVWISEHQRQALTRCIGQHAPLDVDLTIRSLEVGDRYLFCSDGVTKLIRDQELAARMSANQEPDEILRGLIDLANARGGVDNATAVIVIIDQLP